MSQIKPFVEVKTTEGQTLLLRKEAIGAVEVVSGSVRVDGHLKVFVQGFKFLISAEKDDFFAELQKP